MACEGFFLKIAKLDKNAFIPTRATEGSIGYDLYSPKCIAIYPKCNVCIKTNLAFGIPQGFYGRITSKSGLAFNNGISAFPGTIDTDYIGNICVVLYNERGRVYYVKRGDPIAQFIVQKSFVPQIKEIGISCLRSTERGCKGFGSSSNPYN